MTARSDDPARSRAVVALDAAARTALHAPSVFNTQPWRWRITGETLQQFPREDVLRFKQAEHYDPGKVFDGLT